MYKRVLGQNPRNNRKQNRKETADNLGKTIIRQAVSIPKEV